MLRVLADLDGVVADFDAKFFTLCAAEGWPLDIEPHQQTKRFATDHLIHRADRKAAQRYIDSTRWYRDLPVIEGAVEGLRGLSEVADVWLCTKPRHANRTCRDDKAAWVSRHLGARWVDRLVITVQL